jgi:hypothetical protein
VGPEPTAMRPTPAARRRRQRPPAITARDLAAIRWIGEQFGARADLLAVLLGGYPPLRPGRPGWSAPAPCAITSTAGCAPAWRSASTCSASCG